ncbi:thioredoxin family protein [Pontibacterium granulatum]|uniref:thioredoxin family protein n=1 Tax=Pontibacterium granulatum TaxID=2036029 RepID=UPI00249C342F|nr:thioredoxin family protein [Pontibacterium granulatum]MDI3324505.1 thioredoxin family protein [Pontibacterium granulatum]
MITVKVLGTGCAKCTKTAEVIERVAEAVGANVEVVKETSPEAIMQYQVMRTPAVVIDETLVHSGSIPSQEDIRKWLQS